MLVLVTTLFEHRPVIIFSTLIFQYSLENRFALAALKGGREKEMKLRNQGKVYGKITSAAA